MTFKTLAIVITTNLLCIQAIAQVIYERTYPNAFPSIKDAIQLSDYSTVSFSNNATCYFAGWRHISPTGSIIKEGGLCGESTHSLTYKHIADDSVLVSFREGPLDFNGANYFKISLWTPDSLQLLVTDTLHINYWEDCEWCNHPVHYEAFQYKDNHVVYQRGDTIYSKNVLTGQTDFQESFFYINKIFPVMDGLMVFAEGNFPTYLNSQLIAVNTWLSPIFFNNKVAFDSCLVGINPGIPTSLITVSVFNESTQDIDLSIYFSDIDSLLVRGDILIVVGSDGATQNTIQLNRSFQILDEKPFVYPDSIYTWQLSFYPDRMYAWRSDGIANYKANYRVVYPYLNPHPITYVDLALLDIKVDSMYFWSTAEGSPLILVLSAVIVNQSNDTVHLLTMHHQLEPFQMCDPGVYPRHATGLGTPPGDTARVKFSIGIWEDLLDEPFRQTYYVQHGNHHLDSNRTDNSFEFIYLFSSTEEHSSSVFSAYPNPFHDFISVTEQAESLKLILYDQTGRLLATGYDRLDNLDYLPPGMYILHVIKGHSNGITKVIKME